MMKPDHLKRILTHQIAMYLFLIVYLSFLCYTITESIKIDYGTGVTLPVVAISSLILFFYTGAKAIGNLSGKTKYIFVFFFLTTIFTPFILGFSLITSGTRISLLGWIIIINFIAIIIATSQSNSAILAEQAEGEPVKRNIKDLRK